MKILWSSRHRPLESQLKQLKRLFPDPLIIIDTKPFLGADDIMRRFQSLGADELVIVAPLAVSQALLRRGLKPIVAEMEVADKKSSEVEGDGTREKLDGRRRFYKFVKFKRLERIDIQYSELTNDNGKS